MYKNLGNDDFSNFTQSLENAVFPKCQVRRLSTIVIKIRNVTFKYISAE